MAATRKRRLPREDTALLQVFRCNTCGIPEQKLVHHSSNMIKVFMVS
jgi:hypothetical protein